MEDKNVITYTVEKHVWDDEKPKKNKKPIPKIILIVVVLVGFIASFLLGQFSTSITKIVLNSNDKQNFIQNVLTNKWYFGKDHQNLEALLENKAIKGMTTFDDDKHTEYLSKEEYDLMFSNLQGSIYGIGVVYGNVGGSFVVRKVIKNSPAEKAGVKINDILIKVNGESIVGKTIQDIAEKVRGAKNTPVTIGYLRNNEEHSMEIVRDVVSTTLEYSIINDVGIIHLNSFTENGYNEVKEAFKTFKAQNINKVIIDLRDNGGGYLNTTLEIASLILPRNTVILQQEDVKGNITANKTNLSPEFQFDKMAILINENSASASEVLSAALKEQANIPIIGVKSYGKGTVQVTDRFSDGSAIKYTVAQWLTPNGNHINNVGITPDIEVKQYSVLNSSIPELNDTLRVDSVSEVTAYTQNLLNFLSLGTVRTDGYFDENTKAAIEKYQEAQNIAKTGEITYDLIKKLRLDVETINNTNPNAYDLQLQKALEVVNE